jgi:2-polyprenyl-3-methyl-5-hydroxy-6-metoxy-1,4-benzoquinol methylase
MSDKETIAVYNRLGKRYIRAIARGRPPEWKKFVKLLPKGGQVLDVGCAGGRDSGAFSEKGFRVVGIDASPVLLNEARRHVPGVRFLQKDVRKLTFPKNSFDGIWAHAVLLHLKRSEIPGVLKSFFQILKLDGVLYVEVKAGKGARYVAEDLLGGQKRFFTFFTKSEMETLIRKAGFKIIYSAVVPDVLKRKNVPWVIVIGRKPTK